MQQQEISTGEGVVPLLSSIIVPNQLPSINPSSYRIAIVGDFPSEQEEKALQPFIGQSGTLLNSLLSKANITRSCCYIGNVCQHYIPTNHIAKLSWTGEEITRGLAQLLLDLEQFNPHLCVLMGKSALFAAHHSKDIGSWRGSLFISEKEGPFKGRKCLATYHPTHCLKQYNDIPILTIDLKKARAEGESPHLILPKRELVTELTFDELVFRLNNILLLKPKISCDIEGGVTNMSCIGIATSPDRAFIVPFSTLNCESVWNVEEESTLLLLLAQIMNDSEIHKIWQNGLYDRFVLQWAHSIVVRGSTDDTMLKFWEWNCELEKSLGFQASILTKEPFYKMERHAQEQKTFFEYCLKDACVTFEISEKLDKMLSPTQKAHVEFNNTLLNVLLYMELRGIKYDEKLAKTRLQDMQLHVAGYQDSLDAIAENMGVLTRLPFSEGNTAVLAKIKEVCCYKRDKETPKKVFVEEGYYECVELLQTERELNQADRGRLAILTGTTLNTKSSVKFKSFLYTTCKLPTQYKKDPKTKELKPTTDYLALLKLSKNHSHPALKLALELSRLRTRCQMLATPSYQGRMYSSSNLVGTETGRVSSSKSMIYINGDTRVGGNLTTVPNSWDMEDDEHPLAVGMRDMYLADEGCYLGKIDLKGADGNTIAAYLNKIGDTRMTEDIKAGLKPQQFPAFFLKYGKEEMLPYLNDRAALKELFKRIESDDWQYFVSKQLTWGKFYTLGKRKGSEQVFVESEGKINLSEKETGEVLDSLSLRYDVNGLHRYFQKEIDDAPYPYTLTAPNGFTRKFWGRKKEILGQVLAHMPQVITTFTTLTGAYRGWTDPENRYIDEEGKCKLHIEPLHLVHDEQITQWKQEKTEWALMKLKEWFTNTTIVAGSPVTIGYSGSYGLTWAMENEQKIGEIK